ncbi:MAG TPA: hypothetical protein VG326_01845 [Tepidisphaeraceae bacterium]|jgi:hypothetical protein|nr:hypothetical protein [Tepidisphaeraceae bacterium]
MKSSGGIIVIGAIAMLFLGAVAGPASGKPTQSEVFKSIQDSVSESDGSNTRVVPWICGAVGLILVVAWFGRRQTLQANPKPLNNPNRLANEILKSTTLRPRELKQLKVVAEETRTKDGKNLSSPLALLLCPSVLTKAVANRATRADRRTLAQLLKKLESP